jgi:hypothetical protein
MCMDLPDLKPIEPPTTRTMRFIVVCVVAFIVAALAYAYWINMPGLN